MIGPSNSRAGLSWAMGQQGIELRCFHVRGPGSLRRMFPTFADNTVRFSRAGFAASRQRLFRPNLRGPQREILSRKADTMFNRDPIAISLNPLEHSRDAGPFFQSFAAMAPFHGRGYKTKSCANLDRRSGCQSETAIVSDVTGRRAALLSRYIPSNRHLKQPTIEPHK